MSSKRGADTQPIQPPRDVTTQRVPRHALHAVPARVEDDVVANIDAMIVPEGAAETPAPTRRIDVRLDRGADLPMTQEAIFARIKALPAAQRRSLMGRVKRFNEAVRQGQDARSIAFLLADLHSQVVAVAGGQRPTLRAAPAAPTPLEREPLPEAFPARVDWAVRTLMRLKRAGIATDAAQDAGTDTPSPERQQQIDDLRAASEILRQRAEHDRERAEARLRVEQEELKRAESEEVAARRLGDALQGAVDGKVLLRALGGVTDESLEKWQARLDRHLDVTTAAPEASAIDALSRLRSVSARERRAPLDLLLFSKQLHRQVEGVVYSMSAEEVTERMTIASALGNPKGADGLDRALQEVALRGGELGLRSAEDVDRMQAYLIYVVGEDAYLELIERELPTAERTQEPRAPDERRDAA